MTNSPIKTQSNKLRPTLASRIWLRSTGSMMVKAIMHFVLPPNVPGYSITASMLYLTWPPSPGNHKMLGQELNQPNF